MVLSRPKEIGLSRVELTPPGPGDVVVETEWSGISTGTERLLFEGRMPAFPGMGYPLVPGYESVGQVVDAGATAAIAVGTRVFVPGARCFGDLRGLFGGAASRLVVAANRVIPVPTSLEEEGILLALTATAQHALSGGTAPELIVGHGVLGRLLARLAVLDGGSPIVWETNGVRRSGASGYSVIDPSEDERHDYRSIYDVSGDASLLDTLIARLGHGGEIVLAGFYTDRPSFDFPPAFMRETRLRIAAEWQPPDLAKVRERVSAGQLSLGGLITHRQEVLVASDAAADAYRTAFDDPTCLKMLLDWRACS